MFRYSLIILVSFALLPAFAYADTKSFEGKWRQIASTAGDCDTCAVEFTATIKSMTVKANNGWNAKLRAPSGVQSNKTSGQGYWDARAGFLSGRPFQAHFEITGSHLFMKMVVRKTNGKDFEIKAIFERANLPSV